MVDILYVVGTGSKRVNDLPLRWSLRSIAKFASNVGRIVVVGYPPAWLSDKAVSLPFKDPYRGKHWNILACIRHAVKCGGLKGRFLYSSDDHYLLKPADMDLWPRYHKGYCKNFFEYCSERGEVPGPYQMSIVATRRLLERSNLSHLMSCCHMNTWMDADDMETVWRLAWKAKELTPGYGPEPSCLFGAVRLEKAPDTEFTECPDDTKVVSADDLKRKVESDLPAFSTANNAEMQPGLVAAMDALFPEKSPWERQS